MEIKEHQSFSSSLINLRFLHINSHIIAEIRNPVWFIRIMPFKISIRIEQKTSNEVFTSWYKIQTSLSTDYIEEYVPGDIY